LVATVFVAGCPWRCGYCHNSTLQPRSAGGLDWPAVRAVLAQRVGFLDGVVFSGGEPTLAPQLADWMQDARQLGMAIGLHTAGIYPQRLAALKGLVDWIGLDIKAAPGGVDAVTGVPGSEVRMWQALDIALASGAALECRTTLDPRVMSADSLYRLADTLQAKGVTHAVLQQAGIARATPCSPPNNGRAGRCWITGSSASAIFNGGMLRLHRRLHRPNRQPAQTGRGGLPPCEPFAKNDEPFNLLGPALADFLSCLSGSERQVHLAAILTSFLSCLSGSEPYDPIPEQPEYFLSCLSGSERIKA
uniref:Radical SAM core domain-containing protein n=1 Tax=Anopheles coluzzii TaxID=1518534 RepID=A0A8W7PG09_ANOCL